MSREEALANNGRTWACEVCDWIWHISEEVCLNAGCGVKPANQLMCADCLKEAVVNVGFVDRAEVEAACAREPRSFQRIWRDEYQGNFPITRPLLPADTMPGVDE